MFCENNWLILTFEVVNGDFSYYDEQGGSISRVLRTQTTT